MGFQDGVPDPIAPSQMPQNPYQMPSMPGSTYGYNAYGYGGYPQAPQQGGGVPVIPGMNGNGIGVNAYGGSPGNPISGVGMQYDGTNISMLNPGMMNPSQLNPYASMYMNQINGMMNQFSSSAAGGAFNPQFYQHMQDTSQANLTTGIENSYARAGLGGSSAAMGGISSGIERNQMDWLNRQQGDQMHALQGMEGLAQMGFKDTMGIQGQYGEFQDTYNQDILSLLGVNQQADASKNQMLGQGLGGIGQLGMAAAFLI